MVAHTWNRMDNKLKVAAAIAGSLMTIGGALWAGIAATSRVARFGLERSFATKADLAGAENTIRAFHEADMKNHLAWSAEHDEVLIMKSIDRTVARLARDGYLARRSRAGDRDDE